MSYSVLLCDDAMFTRVMITGIISDAGFMVVGQAENGQEAVDQYDRLRPDIVVLDIVMPDMSGLEAARAIRKLDPDACIVMCSAMGQEKLMEEALAAGARSFIVKPFTRSRVLEALSDAVS
jgi:two-component system chemotaxis response regulator CheY